MSTSPVAQHYDVLVVGSGFGGSVTALRLTEKGYRVGVLEAGARFEDDELPDTSWDLQKYLFRPEVGCYGIQRIDPLKDCMILSGAGVGGSSTWGSTITRSSSLRRQVRCRSRWALRMATRRTQSSGRS